MMDYLLLVSALFLIAAIGACIFVTKKHAQFNAEIEVFHNYIENSILRLKSQVPAVNPEEKK